MTPVQLNSLISVHEIANETDPKKQKQLTEKLGGSNDDRVHVTAENAPAVLTALASQRLPKN